MDMYLAMGFVIVLEDLLLVRSMGYVLFVMLPIVAGVIMIILAASIV